MNETLKRLHTSSRQRGGITMFSAVLILILLTELVIYAVQTGVFEQRKSSNELRQKLAFHIADSAIQQGKEFLRKNSVLVSSSRPDLLPNGTDGWLAPTSELRWQPCSAITGTSGTHPCFGEPVAALRAGTYYYAVESDGTSGFSNAERKLPLNPEALGATNPVTDNVELYALLCMLEIDRTKDPVVQGCTTDPALQDQRYFMVTLLARGRADCDATGANCTAKALITDKIGSFGPGLGEGGPDVPLTARTAVPLSGTVEAVPNPNAGGPGVPISTWANNNSSCPGPSPVPPVSPDSGSYSTCERHEWYGMAEYPADYKCPTANCSCNKNDDRLLSYAQGNNRQLGIDIVIDDEFPCDLWEYLFGYSKSEWAEVKKIAPNHLANCDSLNANSFGIYWIEGGNCDLRGQIGSVFAPVFLISTSNTRINANTDLFGVLMVTDVLNANVEFSGNGRGTIYGAAIMDATMKNFNGTFQIIYLENVISLASELGGFGEVAGGWSDFPATWQ